MAAGLSSTSFQLGLIWVFFNFHDISQILHMLFFFLSSSSHYWVLIWSQLVQEKGCFSVREILQVILIIEIFEVAICLFHIVFWD